MNLPRKAWPCIHLARGDSGEAEQRRREIHEADEALRNAARLIIRRAQFLPFFRNVNHQRHLQAAVIRPTLAARHPGAVVGIIENDGVFGEAGGIEFFEARSGIGVRLADGIVILRPIAAHFGRIGMVGGHAHFGRIVNGLVRANAQLAFVAFRGIENREKRLVWRAVFPVRLTRRFVPNFAGFRQVVIGFDVVGAIVTGGAQKLRIHLRAARHRNHAAHMLGAGRRRIHSANQRAARRSAHRRVRPAKPVNHALFRQSVHVGRRGVTIAVTTHVRAVIFAGQP